MAGTPTTIPTQREDDRDNEASADGVIDRAGLERLFIELQSLGYELIGPRVIDQVIVYDTLDAPSDLPIGLKDRQAPGSYRLSPRDDEAHFGFVIGPQSFKPFLFPARERIFAVSQVGAEPELATTDDSSVKRAFIGVRPCDLAAIAVQDKIFLGGSFVDPHYKARRENVFIVAVNCAEPADTCFCSSMGTGPDATAGYDLALTELIDDGRHEFFIETGSERGASLLSALPIREVTERDRQRRIAVTDRARESMGRSMRTDDVKELLYRNHECTHWDRVAERCLSCANCTLVCPTCFCSTVEDTTDLTGDHAERWRQWDSCFNLDHSYIVGGRVRATTQSRYRQWITHKLASWQDQFGMMGCVGCGRCITWCPVGIDITEEIDAIRRDEDRKAHAQEKEK